VLPGLHTRWPTAPVAILRRPGSPARATGGPQRAAGPRRTCRSTSRTRCVPRSLGSHERDFWSGSARRTRRSRPEVGRRGAVAAHDVADAGETGGHRALTWCARDLRALLGRPDGSTLDPGRGISSRRQRSGSVAASRARGSPRQGPRDRRRGRGAPRGTAQHVAIRRSSAPTPPAPRRERRSRRHPR